LIAATSALLGFPLKLSRQGLRSQRGIIHLTGANSNDALDVRDENLAVTDLARVCRPRDRANVRFDKTMGTATSTLVFGTKLMAGSMSR
jgi:hypothetical protein